MNPVSGYNPDQPWERQPFDTDLSWAWFQEFLFLPPPRALIKLARRDGCPWNWTQLESLAYSDAWKERAEAWDRHMSGLRRKQVEQEIQETARDVAARHSRGWRRAFGIAVQELAKYSRSKMISLASELVEGVKPEHYQSWGIPGIRAQLLDIRKRKLEMDFILEGDSRSMHVLNAVSPAFTCSLPFSEYVCERIKATLS